jgi:Ca2+-binding RTX toxin-like protein
MSSSITALIVTAPQVYKVYTQGDLRDSGIGRKLWTMDTTRINTARTTSIAVTLAMLAGALLATAPEADAKPRCFGKKATVVGTNGNDRLKGSKGSDVIVARGGNDSVSTGPRH